MQEEASSNAAEMQDLRTEVTRLEEELSVMIQGLATAEAARLAEK